MFKWSVVDAGFFMGCLHSITGAGDVNMDERLYFDWLDGIARS